MLQYTKLTNYKIKKIMKCFCIDIDATKTAKLLGINRNTINRFYIIFRRAIYYDRIAHITKMLNCMQHTPYTRQ
jgi:transposase